MHGELSGFMRLFSVVKSMDSLVGPDFEKGWPGSSGRRGRLSRRSAGSRAGRG